jgi:hypothetical protein
MLQYATETPHPEQTSSWLSMVLYTWLDPIVFKAHRVPHLPQEELPPLADHDYSRNLKKKSFPVCLSHRRRSQRTENHCSTSIPSLAVGGDISSSDS